MANIGAFTATASMAIGRLRTIDDAPARGPERSGGWRRSVEPPRPRIATSS